jgi:crossover junction endodeoxyribonuclease RuvC
MKVLAIDPGYGRCGMAIVDRVGAKDTLLYSTCIETSPQDAFSVRLRAVADHCEHLMHVHAPEALVLEKLFFKQNKTTAIRVAEVRGALIALAAAKDIPVFEYSPAEVKSAVTGSGAADKKQIAAMLRLLVRIEKRNALDDEYDAIALGITHMASARVLSIRERV